MATFLLPDFVLEGIVLIRRLWQTWGYPTEGAYYRDASSVDSLLAVRIPLFAIHAEDDPVRFEYSRLGNL